MLSIHEGHSGLVNAQKKLGKTSRSNSNTANAVLDTQLKNLEAEVSMKASSKVVKTADEMIGTTLDIKI